MTRSTVSSPKNVPQASCLPSRRVIRMTSRATARPKRPRVGKTAYTLGAGNRLASSSTTSNSTLFVSGTANEPIGTDERWGTLSVSNLTAGASVVPSVNGSSFYAEVPNPWKRHQHARRRHSGSGWKHGLRNQYPLGWGNPRTKAPKHKAMRTTPPDASPTSTAQPSTGTNAAA